MAVKSKLKAVAPKAVEKRLKALFYGAAGVGKTTACIQFPKPYLIDTEKGGGNDQYIKLLEKSGGVILQTSDFDEILNEVKTLLTEQHEYKTLIIDPLTTVYNNLLDSSAEKVGTEFGRHYTDANKYIKRLINLLLRLDMNILITAHAKNEYGDNMKVLGQTFDCQKKLDYIFDLVIEVQKRGRERVGVVKKTRISNFNEMESFPFAYSEFAEKYGREILERDAIAQELATPDQVAELNRLVALLKIDADVTTKWLEKAQASTFDEMERSQVNACIAALSKKLKPEESTAA